MARTKTLTAGRSWFRACYRNMKDDCPLRILTGGTSVRVERGLITQVEIQLDGRSPLVRCVCLDVAVYEAYSFYYFRKH
jgi:hypothetical protein